MSIKILADENVDYRIIKTLRNEGIEVVALVEESPGITDFEVIERAIKLDAVLLTEDADFGRLVFAYGKKINGVIYLRYPSVQYSRIAKILTRFLTKNWDNIQGEFSAIDVKIVLP